MSNPPYGGVELPFLKGDLEGFLNVVAHPLANGLGNCARRLTGNYKISEAKKQPQKGKGGSAAALCIT